MLIAPSLSDNHAWVSEELLAHSVAALAPFRNCSRPSRKTFFCPTTSLVHQTSFVLLCTLDFALCTIFCLFLIPRYSSLLSTHFSATASLIPAAAWRNLRGGGSLPYSRRMFVNSAAALVFAAIKCATKFSTWLLSTPFPPRDSATKLKIPPITEQHSHVIFAQLQKLLE